MSDSNVLNDKQAELCEQSTTDFSDLRALFINCTLKRSPETSNTQGLMDISMEIMRRNQVEVECIRAVDHEIATGVWPDMTEHGWEADEWPAIYEKVMDADILVLGMSIWLGEKSSIATQIVERLYGNSHLLNDAGQYAYYGRVGGCLVTGNEDGVKHCAMNVLYSLQHLGYTIPPQADAGWIGEAGPGPSYLDEGSGGPRERLHEPQHHLRDLEHAARGADAEGRRRDPRARKPALRVGRRLPVRFPEPGASLVPGTPPHRPARPHPPNPPTEWHLRHPTNDSGAVRPGAVGGAPAARRRASVSSGLAIACCQVMRTDPFAGGLEQGLTLGVVGPSGGIVVPDSAIGLDHQALLRPPEVRNHPAPSEGQGRVHARVRKASAQNQIEHDVLELASSRRRTARENRSQFADATTAAERPRRLDEGVNAHQPEGLGLAHRSS